MSGNLATVAIFFSGVTASTIQYIYSADTATLSVAINLLWITSLVLSTGSAIISTVGGFRIVSSTRRSPSLSPWYISAMMNEVPKILLGFSACMFLAGMVCFTFQMFRQQYVYLPILVSTTTAAIVAGILLLMSWSKLEEYMGPGADLHPWFATWVRFTDILQKPKRWNSRSFDWASSAPHPHALPFYTTDQDAKPMQEGGQSPNFDEDKSRESTGNSYIDAESEHLAPTRSFHPNPLEIPSDPDLYPPALASIQRPADWARLTSSFSTTAPIGLGFEPDALAVSFSPGGNYIALLLINRVEIWSISPLTASKSQLGGYDFPNSRNRELDVWYLEVSWNVKGTHLLIERKHEDDYERNFYVWDLEV